MTIYHLKRCPLSKLNTFDQNFMKFCHIFNTMMSSSSSIMVHIAPCFQQLWPFLYKKFTVLNGVRSLSRILFIRILLNLVTLLSTCTLMSSSSSIMVHIAPGFKELLTLVYEKLLVKRRLLSKMNSFDYNSMKLGHIITCTHIMSSSFRMAHIASCLQESLPFVNDNSLFMLIWQ